MAKSKEQCNIIIYKNFDGLEEEKRLLEALVESIKEICSSEFAILWYYNKEANRVSNLMEKGSMVLKLNGSLLEQTILSKEGFFDNHIASHRKFNPILDNPLKIKIKALLMTPVLTPENEVLGVIATFNSVKHPEAFQRYDLRCLKLLNKRALEILSSVTQEKAHSIAQKVDKKEEFVSSVSEALPIEVKKSRVTIEELEHLIQTQEQKIDTLEKKLAFKQKLLEEKEQEKSEILASMASRDMETIFKFLSNEVTYFANEEYKIYLLLEIIKNALHDKEQLSFINSEIVKSDFIKRLANDLYAKEKTPLQIQSFNTYQMISDTLDLYSNICKEQEIFFHLYISPHLPSQIETDEEKLKSLLVHLINNAYGLVEKRGTIEFLVSFSEEKSSLEIEIRSLKAKERKSFLHRVHSNHSLIKGKNRGLGLSASSNLVNLLGGKLKLTTMGKEEHSFEVNIPIVVSKIEKKSFHSKVPLKIGILSDESNLPALKNLEYYLASFGIAKSTILMFKSYKKIGNIKLSHLFCFENMLSSKLNTASSSSFIILKYSQESMAKKYNFKREVEELLVNCYYGTELEQILFPDMKVEEVERGAKKGILEKFKRFYS